MVSAWRMSPATGENQGIFSIKALASFIAAREVSTALIPVSSIPPIGSDEAGSRRVAEQGPIDEFERERRVTY
jgi:hypothetical protein